MSVFVVGSVYELLCLLLCNIRGTLLCFFVLFIRLLEDDNVFSGLLYLSLLLLHQDHLCENRLMAGYPNKQKCKLIT